MSIQRLKIKRRVPLLPLTTFGIGGNAKFFAEVKSAEEFKEAVKFARQTFASQNLSGQAGENKLPIFVIGGGSNILVSDNGFEGLVIKINILGLWITDIASRLSTGGEFVNTPTHSSRKATKGASGWRVQAGAGPVPEKADAFGNTKLLLRCGAGQAWDDVVAKAVGYGAGGIENLSLIPGTVGGAVCQNIGAYGVELKDVLDTVSVFNISTSSIKRLSNKECEFGYRSSIFKKNKNLIILEAELLLSKNHKPNISYPDLQKRFEGQEPSISEIRNAVMEIRKSKLVYPDETGTAGSFFKNPVISLNQFEKLKNKYPDLRGNPVRSRVRDRVASPEDRGAATSYGIKLYAAQLIEKCGFKGKRVGNIGVSDKHSLVLVNYGGGTAQEIMELASIIAEGVKKEFGVVLENEVAII